jgi:hypothetical protein
MSNPLSLVNEYERLITCPIEWTKETPGSELDFSILMYDWQVVLGENTVSGEEHLFDLDDDFIYEDPELEHIVELLSLRHDVAVTAYKRRSGRLADMKFLSQAEHGKHFVPPMFKSDVVERSRKGVSLFFSVHGPGLLRETFWHWFTWYFGDVLSLEEFQDLITPGTHEFNSVKGQVWQKFMKDHQLRVCLDAMSPVGATAGEETSTLCFDIHIDSKTVHSYPVSRVEAVQIMNSETIDVIDYFNC